MHQVLFLAVFGVSPIAQAGQKQCESAVQRHATLGSAYLNEGSCEYALSEFLKAESACKKAASRPDIQHWIGMAFFCKEMFDEAESRVQRALTLSERLSRRLRSTCRPSTSARSAGPRHLDFVVATAEDPLKTRAADLLRSMP